MSVKIYSVDRTVQIRMFDDMSVLKDEVIGRMNLRFDKSEMYMLQLALVADEDCILNRVDYKGDGLVDCINTHKVDYKGIESYKSVKLKSGVIQPLFIMIDCSGSEKFDQSGEMTLSTSDRDIVINLSYALGCCEVANKGYNDLWRLSRLKWLNSTLGQDNTVPAPYKEIHRNGEECKIIGRDIAMPAIGIPSEIYSYFDESVDIESARQVSMLNKPMTISIVGMELKYSEISRVNLGNMLIIKSHAENDMLEINITSKLHYEGYIDYKYVVKAKANIDIDSLDFSMVLDNYVSKYSYGFGKQGGLYADGEYAFSANKQWDCMYIGNINAGVRVKFKAEKYVKPLANIYYASLPVSIPTNTWDNNGSGKLLLNKSNAGTKVTFATGLMSLTVGDERSFDMDIHIVPFKQFDKLAQSKVRYYHNNNVKNEDKDISIASKRGMSHMIFHHANRVNPFINYPFVEVERLKETVRKAKELEIAVKLYYTVREHSNHMAEVFAYKALGNEIVMRRPSLGANWLPGKRAWLDKYFGNEIIPAWRVLFKKHLYNSTPDESFIVNPASRLDNYYIEGLNWLVKECDIKGIYIDDTALDRTTLERAKKILSQNNGLIDMHTWNHEEARAGDATCVNLYTDIMPFIDSMWIGEGFNVEKLSPDYIITEVSTIHYGLGSQMLEAGGNHYIGMLYYMNNRYGWGSKDAHHLYAIWDRYDIGNSKMYGYWHSKKPVTASNKDVYVTSYVDNAQENILVCMYNFSDNNVTFDIVLKEILASVDMNNYIIEVPKLKGYQKEKLLNSLQGIAIKKRDGLIIALKAKHV